MIELHRLTHPDAPFLLNPDVIVMVESTPDTVISLENSTKVVVIETPAEVADRVRSWRSSIIAGARTAQVVELRPQ